MSPWYLQKRMIVDELKYRGKGRPRKIDYREYPDEKRDMVIMPRAVFGAKVTKYGFKYKVRVIHTYGS